MLLIFEPADLARYSPPTRAEVLADTARRFGAGAATPPPPPAASPVAKYADAKWGGLRGLALERCPA